LLRPIKFCNLPKLTEKTETSSLFFCSRVIARKFGTAEDFKETIRVLLLKKAFRNETHSIFNFENE